MRRNLAVLSLSCAVACVLAGPAGRAMAQVPAADAPGTQAAPAEADAEMTPEQRADYVAALRELARSTRAAMFDRMTARIEARQVEKLDRISFLLSLFALSGALLLFMPFFLRRKYPDRMGVLVRYSALAALLFYLAVNLFAVVLLLMRGTQSAFGEYTNPQIKLVSATFDLIEDKADEMAEVGPLLIEPTLQSLSAGGDGTVLGVMLENVNKLRNDVSVFSSIARMVERLDWLFGMLPLLFVGLALVLFGRVTWPTLSEIARLPERAAQGQRGAVRHTLRLTLRNVWAEARATFCVVGVLIALSLLASWLLGLVLQPAIEVFMAYLALAFIYIQVDAAAGSFWILASLMGALLFLLVNLAVILLTTILVLLKAQKIFQQRFRAGVPLRAHRRFWQWGAAGAVWIQLLPVLYVAVAVKAIGWFVEASAERMIDQANPAASNWPFLLVSGPLLFLLGFAFIFWLGRGVSALGFLARYRVDGQGYAAVDAAEHAFTAAGARGA